MARHVFELKKLSPEGVPAALDKAERYRLLNEPIEAESICLDVLAVDPDEQRALVTLFLALTDQLETRLATAYEEAHALLPRIDSEYGRIYYEGILAERRGGAHQARGGAQSGAIAGDWFRRAMDLYERAEALRPAGNDDALIRWNTCARILMRHPELDETADEPMQSYLE
jgi:hypothetical protein